MEILKSKENDGNFFAIKKKIETINKVLENKYDFLNIKVDLMSKSKFLLYISYNSCNNTPQASLQCSPRGVTF